MKRITFILALALIFMLQGCFWGRPGDGGGRRHDEGHHEEHHDGGDHH